jgi:geranylgeranylglycerol-phosphate geranylgeranyltransferase
MVYIMRKWIIIWMRLSRPLIGIISVFGTMVGAVTIAGFINPQNLLSVLHPLNVLMMTIGALSLSSGLMVHNDFTDFESDKVNRPHKVLPSGLVNRNTAQWTGLILMILSIILSLFTTFFNRATINWLCGLLTLSVVIVGILYNYRGKFWGIWGHIFVAYGVGCIPLWGAVAVAPEKGYAILPLAASIFIMEIGREIMVCAGDIEGDSAAGYKTTPIRLGRTTSMWMVLVFYIFFTLLIPISFFGWFGFPKLFSFIYLSGAYVFALILFITWARTLQVVLKGEKKAIWDAFEKYIRTETRIGVLFFQLTIFLDAFF